MEDGRDSSGSGVSGRNKPIFYGFPNAFVEKPLGVAATSRWNTITRIVHRFA